MTLKELIKNSDVVFDSLRQGFAYYKLRYQYIDPSIPKEDYGLPEVVERFSREDHYLFTVPLDDIGNGTLRNHMRSMELLRWIRKAFESGELVLIREK